MLHSGEGSEYVFEDRPTVGMIQGVRLRCLMTEIRNLQDSQDCGILPDTAVMNLTSQPLPDRFTPSPARGHLTACYGKGVYSSRRRRPLEQPCSQEGNDRITPAPASGRDGPAPVVPTPLLPAITNAPHLPAPGP